MNHQLAKQVEDLEVELLQPEARRSAKRISELLANDFVEFGMFGKIYSKEDFVELLPNSKEEQFEKYQASDFKAKEVATDTILLTYKASIAFLKTNEKIWTLRSSIWQKRDDNWQMIFHQGTVIKDANNNN
jgi:hypothetical protein